MTFPLELISTRMLVDPGLVISASTTDGGIPPVFGLYSETNKIPRLVDPGVFETLVASSNFSFLKYEKATL